MCILRKRIRSLICNHPFAVEKEEGWEFCRLNAKEDPAVAEAHWELVPNKDEKANYIAEEVRYLCPTCWNATVASQWDVVAGQWRHRLAQQDWDNMIACGKWLVEQVEARDRRRSARYRIPRWCCGAGAPGGADHNPFLCVIEDLLLLGAGRKAEVEQGGSFEPLWTDHSRKQDSLDVDPASGSQA